MLVSIITPSFNSANYIVATIQSVLAQTYQNWEMIIVDDCSIDNSCDVIEKYMEEDSRIKLLRLSENSGVAAARNTGLDYARGDFVAFLDSDDKWFKTKLEKQINIFNQYPEIDIIYTAYHRFNNHGIIKLINVPESINYKQLLKGNPIGNLTAIYNFKKYPDVRQKKIGHEDYLFWLEIFRSSKEIKGFGIQEPLAYYRVAEDGQSISGNKLKAAGWTWEIYRKHLQLSLIGSLFYFSYYMIKAILKRV